MRCASIMHLQSMTFPVAFDVQLQSLPMSFVKHTQHAHKSDPWHQKTPKYNSSPAKHCLPCLASTEWSATAPSKSFCGSRSPFYWWPWRLHRSETAHHARPLSSPLESLDNVFVSCSLAGTQAWETSHVMHGTLGACVSFLFHPFMLPFGNGTLNEMFVNHAFAQHDIPCCVWCSIAVFTNELC